MDRNETLWNIMEISNDFAIWSQYSQEIIILLSLDYKILAFNPVAEKIYGWNQQKAIGKNFLNLSAQPKLSAAFLERTKEILAGEIVQVKAELYEQQYTLEWTIARKLNADNSPVGFLLVAQDVTRLCTLQKALKKSE
ncbi:MAG TPA: PAS domain S-box protein, partial [Gammaproteobacteria bacterium]|nr:PAS domain S-box protein [Gammaproteobacteria bacterium]